jgi:hypothetical protein
VTHGIEIYIKKERMDLPPTRNNGNAKNSTKLPPNSATLHYRERGNAQRIKGIKPWSVMSITNFSRKS